RIAVACRLTNRPGLGQAGGALCQLTPVEIGNAQIPGDQAAKCLSFRELLECLKRKVDGAGHVPMSVGDKRTDSCSSASVFDWSPVAQVEVRWLYRTNRRRQR